MLKVFLIEDAPRIRSILIEFLLSTGKIEVVGVAEGQQEAVQSLRALAWDVAIIDIALREGSGLDVLRALNEDTADYGTRLVFTNHPNSALRDRALALGAQAFFDKSHEMEKLVDCVTAMAN